MNNYTNTGKILYNYARDRCYLVLERTINLASAWKCIYRDEDGLYRLYYISDEELEKAADGIWKVLPGVTVTDMHLNAIIRGGKNGFDILGQVFDLTRDQVMKMKNDEKKKENA